MALKWTLQTSQIPGRRILDDDLQLKLAGDTAASRPNLARQIRSCGPSVQVQAEEDEKDADHETYPGCSKTVHLCGRVTAARAPPCSFHVNVVGPHLSSFLDDRL
jgi:hypothetical protein